MNVWRCFGGIVAIVVVALPIVALSKSKQAQVGEDLIVHEWGTFLAMQGSDGTTLDGMYHEEHALPEFVHSRGRDQLRLPTVQLKGETPVIYFYTERPQKVSVAVNFPRGIWTQWFPQAQSVSPQLSGPEAAQLKNGRITWFAELIPHKLASSVPTMPATSPDALWNFARDVDAAFVKTSDRTKNPAKDELDRFLFYRGLGRATLPLALKTSKENTLTALPLGTMTAGLKHLFLLRVENGIGTYRYLPSLAPGESVVNVVPSLDDALPLDEFTARVADELAERLTECGLYTKEARAMVNTWRTSYFGTEGIRVLFVLPQGWTDEFIPLTVSPRPRETVRVMVGRLEVLTPERERLVENAVRDLSSPNSETRTAAFDTLRDQGRYVEPVVRRVLAQTNDQSVKTLCRRLLATDFITDLRTALDGPTTREKGFENPDFVRGRLASLLREAGLDEQAAAEGKKAIGELSKMEPPRMTESKSREYLRALALAKEGSGDASGAIEAYVTFIRFGSQVATLKQCVNCHRGREAPLDMAWFRNWWAGERFARLARESDQTEKLLSAQEATLRSDPRNASALLMSAYLYRAKGDSVAAEQAWRRLDASREGAEPVAANTAGKR